MTSGYKKDNRHGKLEKIVWGKYARKEVALYGTTCEEIEHFTAFMQKALDPYFISYIDASHAESPTIKNELTHRVTFGLSGIYIATKSQPEITQRLNFLRTDLAVINGNHFEGDTQIILYNPDKEVSLLRRKKQLTHVLAVVLPDGLETFPDHLIQELSLNLQLVRIFHQRELEFFIPFIRQHFLTPPPLKALVLTGGKSSRMGTDKSNLIYHSTPQYLHLYELLKRLQVEEVLISCRAEQRAEYESEGLKILEDRMIDMGPLGGILSAFMQEPCTAWLVVACDLPLVDADLIMQLLESRDPAKSATAFLNEEFHLPEPLLSIWEPKIYSEALLWLSWGYSCPRKVLINTNCKLLNAPDGGKLANINTPAEYTSIKNQLSSSSQHHAKK